MLLHLVTATALVASIVLLFLAPIWILSGTWLHALFSSEVYKPLIMAKVSRVWGGNLIFGMGNPRFPPLCRDLSRILLRHRGVWVLSWEELITTSKHLCSTHLKIKWSAHWINLSILGRTLGYEILVCISGAYASTLIYCTCRVLGFVIGRLQCMCTNTAQSSQFDLPYYIIKHIVYSTPIPFNWHNICI